jgi:hypothetical protein
LPKPSLIATQEFIDGQLIYRGGNKDEALKWFSKVNISSWVSAEA